MANLSPENDEGASFLRADLLAELRRRSAAYRAGTTSTRDAADVLADLQGASGPGSRRANLRLLAEAEAEIESARRELNQQAPVLGTQFLGDLAQTISRIREQPRSFPTLEPGDQSCRQAPLEKCRYAILFECRANEIVGIALGRNRRQPSDAMSGGTVISDWRTFCCAAALGAVVLALVWTLANSQKWKFQRDVSVGMTQDAVTAVAGVPEQVLHAGDYLRGFGDAADRVVDAETWVYFVSPKSQHRFTVTFHGKEVSRVEHSQN